MSMKNYPFTQKTPEELAKEMNAELVKEESMTPEEVVEDDAEGGYFQNEEE